MIERECPGGSARCGGQIPKVSDPLARYEPTVIPSERSESRDLHLAVRLAPVRQSPRGARRRIGTLCCQRGATDAAPRLPLEEKLYQFSCIRRHETT